MNFLQQVEPRSYQIWSDPEFIGRVRSWFHRAAYKGSNGKVLSEPKNALTKQYKKLFELDDVNLGLHKALEEVANLAVKRRSQCRGLRFHPENTASGSDVAEIRLMIQ